MAKLFKDVAKKVMSKEAIQKADVQTKGMLKEMLLAEIRELSQMSQSQLADVLGIKQPSLSKMEKSDDMRISTLRCILNALGYEMRITAVSRKREVRVNQFDEDQVGERILQLV